MLGGGKERERPERNGKLGENAVTAWPPNWLT